MFIIIMMLMMMIISINDKRNPSRMKNEVRDFCCADRKRDLKRVYKAMEGGGNRKYVIISAA